VIVDPERPLASGPRRSSRGETVRTGWRLRVTARRGRMIVRVAAVVGRIAEHPRRRPAGETDGLLWQARLVRVASVPRQAGEMRCSAFGLRSVERSQCRRSCGSEMPRESASGRTASFDAPRKRCAASIACRSRQQSTELDYTASRSCGRAARFRSGGGGGCCRSPAPLCSVARARRSSRTRPWGSQARGSA
jgi:hypothetical protein